MKVLICTMASGWYEKLAPLFEYTAKKYNPDCDVKVFRKDDIFPDYPNNATPTLRFLMPNKYFEGYDYVYITDVDFVFLKHNPLMMNYHLDVMRRTGQPYSAYRGRTHSGKKLVWDGKFTRIAGGHVVVSQEWLKRTEDIRSRILLKIKNGVDMRVRDEIVLYRIFRAAGIPTPRQRRCMFDGAMFNKEYRNLHLGDFRDAFGKKRWTKNKRMKAWYFSDHSVKMYRKLLMDDKYRELITKACADSHIEELFHNLNYHLGRR